MTTTIALADVLEFVRNTDDTATLATITDAAKSRREYLSTSLPKGTPVRITNIRPKYLTGLTGTVDSASGGKLVIVVDELHRSNAARFIDPIRHTIKVHASCVQAV